MQEPPLSIAFAFPAFFIGLWLLIVTILSAVSGWKGLQTRFPDRADDAVETFQMCSGVMRGVNMNNILTLTAGRTGLRVAIWRIFGPFDRPFLVPWEQITVARHGGGIWRRAVLIFGDPSEGKLQISGALADKLARAAGSRWPEATGRNTPIVS